jgi:hypothetical protein
MGMSDSDTMWHMDRARYYARVGEDARALRHLSKFGAPAETPDEKKCGEYVTTENQMMCYKQLC